MDKIYRLTACEGVFAPCFDQILNQMERYSYSGCTCQQSWDSVSVTGSGERFSVSWRGSVSTGHYDRLLVCLNFGSHIEMTLRAVINGEERGIFEKAPGEGLPSELSGNIPRNSVLTEVIMDFKVNRQPMDTNFVTLRWLGLSDSSLEGEVETFPRYDENSWSEYIRSEVRYADSENLMFTEGELKKISAALQSERMKGIAAKLYQSAAEHEGDMPEKEIREFLPVGEHLYRYARVRDRGRKPLNFSGLAVAGYFFRKKEWSLLAARKILCAVKTPNWFEGPQCCMEGSTWHHVCFTEQSTVSDMIIALSFLQGVFTEKALGEIKAAIEKNYRRIVKCCEEKGYRRFSNQGIVENAGRLLGACGLYALGDESYLEEVQTAFRACELFMSDYIDEDGYCFEGPGYYLYSVSTALRAWKIYARVFNRDIREVLPENVKKSVRYLNCIMSSLGENGNVVSLNSGGAGSLSDTVLSFFTSVFGWENGRRYMKARLEAGGQLDSDDLMASIMLMCYLPEALDAAPKPLEQYFIFERQGLAAYEWEDGKFWFCAEGNPRTGHYHRDRGSVMLECFGQKLLADPGISNYGKIACAYMPLPDYHNLAHPKDIPMVVQSPIAAVSANEAGVGCSTVVSMADFEKPAARVHYIHRAENGLDFSAEVSELYSEAVIEATREGSFRRSESEAELQLSDSWGFSAEQTLCLNFMAYAPWKIEESRASMRIGGVLLELCFHTEGAFELAADDSMEDYAQRQMYRLRLTAAAAKQHRIRTTAVIRKIN